MVIYDFGLQRRIGLEHQCLWQRLKVERGDTPS